MKRIIDGKKYDTETAKQVGWSDSHHAHTDFQYHSETLYMKRTGEFFMHGEGGPMSEYATSNGNMYGWGEKIIPLTLKKAQQWAEEHLSSEEYESIFGEVAE